MSYTIKSYEEGLIEPQVKLGNIATKNWVGYTMATTESLSDTYSQENFDPETRLYAFKDNELVGFLTCYVVENSDGDKEAHYRLPIVKEDHEEASKQLIQRSFEILKEKDTKFILTSFKDDWGYMKNHASELGFEGSGDPTTFALSSVTDLVVSEVSSNYSIEELDLEKHGEALKSIFQNAFGLDEQGAENNLNLIKTFDQNRIVTHSAIFENDKIIGRALLYTPESDSELAYLGNIYTVDEHEELFFDLFMNHIVKKSKEKGIQTINKTVIGENVKTQNYEKYGFTFDNVIHSYRKDLE